MLLPHYESIGQLKGDAASIAQALRISGAGWADENVMRF
jgi:hypothetical protein